MGIELPGYDVVFENALFAKNSSIRSLDNGDVDVKVILAPTRYVLADTEKILGYLLKKVYEYRATAHVLTPDGRPAVSGKSNLEVLISVLPDGVRRGIIDNSKEVMDFVRANIPEPGENAGKMFLHICYGVIPVSVIEKNLAMGYIKDIEWYKAALENVHLKRAGLGERWNMALLLPDGCLPDKQEMDILLKHNVTDSSTYIVRGNALPNEIREVVEAVYAGLSSNERIMMLRDVSDEALETLAITPVDALIQNIRD